MPRRRRGLDIPNRTSHTAAALGHGVPIVPIGIVRTHVLPFHCPAPFLRWCYPCFVLLKPCISAQTASLCIANHVRKAVHNHTQLPAQAVCSLVQVAPPTVHNRPCQPWACAASKQFKKACAARLGGGERRHMATNWQS